MEETRIRCVVERITYQNSETGYSVLRTSAEGTSGVVTVVGTLPGVRPGAVLEVTGSWEMHPTYGRRFHATCFQEGIPGTLEGMEKYLGSGLIPGVGPAYASRIVSHFKEDTFRILQNEPQRLQEVPGLGSRRAKSIMENWQQQQEVHNVMVFLQSYGISPALAARIYRAYGDDSIRMIKENPFRLADEIWGIGFRTADQLARNMGIQKEDLLRCRSGLLYTMNQLAREGHVFALRDQLVPRAVKLLDAGEDTVSAVLDRMLKDQDLIVEGTALYLPSFYYAERNSALRLLTLASRPPAPIPEEIIRQVLTSSPVRYEPVQEEAIRTAARSRVMVLTGGPGTGKTTTTQGIISLFLACHRRVLLAAPTGRAAKRMTETTGREAKTLHRLLESHPPDGFQRNDRNPLEGDVLIVDECSMIDIQLFYSLIRAVPPDMSLVLVGDVDQLPSVGAGNVLRDIIGCECFPVVRLKQIFRQALNSSIITNAHRVNRGEMPDTTCRSDGDFFFLPREDPEKVAGTIVDLVKNRLPAFCHVNSGDIQVLTPLRKGDMGTIRLNQLLQAALNPQGETITRGNIAFRVQDKVMQTCNNYTKDVYNGDIGFIEEVDTVNQTLKVSYDGRIVPYEAVELDELVHAYAITIHKSQGSEYPIVVMAIHHSQFIMLQRNLLYTGITRAKKLLVLVGNRRGLHLCVEKHKVSDRNSLLAQRLRTGTGTAPS